VFNKFFDNQEKKFLSEHEAEERKRKFENELAENNARFEELLKTQGTADLWIRRRRNTRGQSIERKANKFNPDGSLVLNQAGQAIVTEYIEKTLNDKTTITS